MGLLKSLELQGFKSFASKTVLEFPARVVGIVGPNGSGKSNVIDAFRWVLGEREAKQLRGDTLEHLIFAGTPKRAAVGFAKVGLRFDNRDGLLPLDAQEVALERKIDRSGSSHYYLNDEEVRLKDLVPILARAKLGTRGLAMIGQGQSDLFVQSSPEERREMIEEILGLKEFRIKKGQAERRLFSSRINMDKVQAMVEELLPHLRLLRRQKHRWDKRSELETELATIENEYYSSQYRAFEARATALTPSFEGLIEARTKEEREVAALEAKVKSSDTRAEGTGERAKEVRAAIAARFEKRAAAQAALARIEVKREMLAREKRAATYDAKEAIETLRSFERELPAVLAENEIGAMRAALKGWLERLRRFFKEEKKEDQPDLSVDEKRHKDEIVALDREIADLRKEEEQIASGEEERNRDFRRQVEVLEERKNGLRKLDREIQERKFEHEKIVIRRDEIVNEWRGLGREVATLHALVPEGAHGEEELFAMQRRMARVRGELAAIGEIDTALVNEADESEARYAFLTKELEDLERAIADLKALVKELEGKIDGEFRESFKLINEEFNNYFRLMFGGGRAHMKLKKKPKPAPAEKGGEGEGVAAEIVKEVVEEEKSEEGAGIEVELTLPKKRITSLDMLSGGEKSLVSIAALFALIAVSPPPFLVLDEVDAPLDEPNAQRFAELVKNFSSKTQFLIVTHNRATMEAADVLYGITMGDDGVSKVLSMKMEE